MDRTLSPDHLGASLVVEQMTLDEKIGLVHGAGIRDRAAAVRPGGSGDSARANGGAGFVPGIPRLGLPDLNMADSTVGVSARRPAAGTRRRCR